MALLGAYKNLDRPIRNVIAAEYFQQLVNVTFLNLQPLYMHDEGYSDSQIASAVSWRFLGVLLLALPLGLFIRKRKMEKLFFVSGFGVPFFAIVIITAIHFHQPLLLLVSQLFWGASMTFMQVPVLPFILRYCRTESQTAAIALSYATYSLAGISSAALVSLLNSIDSDIFSERNLLYGMSALGFVSVYFLTLVKVEEPIKVSSPEEPAEKERRSLRDYDWNLILAALVPSLVIAVGAGLTIPVINLFFKNVFHQSTSVISSYNLAGAVLVAIAAMFVPYVKMRLGYRLAIPLTQSFAVLALIMMATTEYYSHLSIALWMAVGCYLLRQPLMNMAGPMTSEVAMKYVGPRNRELTSALISSIWSGSWFIGTRWIFAVLKDQGWPFVSIFLITAALYAVGIFLYYLLIVAYNRREKAGLIEKD